jgi:hypothetical protein
MGRALRSSNCFASCKPFVRRVDRCAGEMNLFLVVPVFGLAALDATAPSATINDSV